MDKNFEITVIGGGPCGILTALILSKLGYKTALLEKKKIRSSFENADNKTTALSYGNLKLFSYLDIYEDIKKYGTEIRKIIISNFEDKNFYHTKKDAPFLIFDPRFAKKDIPFLGLMIKNKNLLNILLTKILSSDVHILEETELLDFPLNNGNYDLMVKSHGKEKTISSNIIICADGRFSYSRKKLNIVFQKHFYNQTAVTFNIAHEKDHKNIAHEIFTPIGPLALLPLGNEKGNYYSSVVWSLENNIYKSFDENEMIIPHTENIISNKFGSIKLTSDIHSHPLSYFINKQNNIENILFIGDASHAIHPIAGQGFNLALKDILSLYDIFKLHKSGGSDLGNNIFRDLIFKKFLQSRSFDNIQFAILADFFNAIFVKDDMITKNMRKYALHALAKNKTFAKYAMLDAASSL